MVQHAQRVAPLIDVVAVGTTVLALLDYAPKVAAVLSIVWLAFQIFTWIRNKGWKRKP